METNVNNEKGFTSVDITVAMIVIMIFASIMTSLIYSVYVSSTEAKRTATALNYGVDIFEAIAGMDYDEVTKTRILQKIGSIDSSYKVTIDVDERYADEIKLIKLKIEYKVSAKNSQSIELERVKVNYPVTT